MPVFPIVALAFTFAGIAYCAVAPFTGIGQTEAIALVLLMLLRGQLWKPAETRTCDVIEALVQGLFVTTLFALFKLANAQGLADLYLPIAVGAGVTAGMLAFALTRDKPLGRWKDLSDVPSVIVAMVAIVAYWHVSQEAPLHMAVVWGLLTAIFFTTPNTAYLYEPIQAQSRGRFAIAELTNRMIFAIGLSFLIAGAEQDYAISLTGASIGLLLVSAYRIWRWQPEVGQSA